MVTALTKRIQPFRTQMTVVQPMKHPVQVRSCSSEVVTKHTQLFLSFQEEHLHASL